MSYTKLSKEDVRIIEDAIGSFEFVSYHPTYIPPVYERNGKLISASSYDKDNLTRYVSYGWSELADNLDDEAGTLIDGIGRVKLVEQVGGEGQGDQYHIIISVTNDDDDVSVRLFKKDGWYASYEGGELDGDFYEVEAREKVVTVYV